MKELVEPIDEHWKKECLESIFGDEPIANLRWDDDEIEWELECVLRRVKPKSKS